MTEPSSTSFTTLRRFVRPRQPDEQCEVCGAGILDEHTHLFDPQHRQLICVCDSCAISMGDRAGTQFRRVPGQVRYLPDFRLTDARWDELLIPVGMAFFFYSSPAGRVLAYYPSPAGPTESLLSLESWEEVVRENPVLQTMQPDVEALLVNRVKRAQEYYLAPIDKCFELVGLMRTHWRGLSGGPEVWEAITAFYDRLKARAQAPEAGARA